MVGFDPIGDGIGGLQFRRSLSAEDEIGHDEGENSQADHKDRGEYLEAESGGLAIPGGSSTEFFSRFILGYGFIEILIDEIPDPVQPASLVSFSGIQDFLHLLPVQGLFR